LYFDLILKSLTEVERGGTKWNEVERSGTRKKYKMDQKNKGGTPPTHINTQTPKQKGNNMSVNLSTTNSSLEQLATSIQVATPSPNSVVLMCPNCEGGPYSNRSNLNKHLKKGKCQLKRAQGVRNDIIKQEREKHEGEGEQTAPEKILNEKGLLCIALWEELPTWHPMRQAGLDAIRELYKNEIGEYTSMTASVSEMFATTPRWSHFFADLQRCSTNGEYLSDGIAQSMDPDLNLALFHESFGHSDSVDHAHCIGAVAFPPSKEGLLACRPSQPKSFRSAIWLADSTEGRLNLFSILTPKGYITDIHLDYSLVGELTMNLIGRKLWIWWPRTKENMLVLERRHLRARPVSLAEGIASMSCPSVAILEPGQSVFMEPGTPHAVMSLDQCALTGYKVGRPEDIGRAKEAFDWEIERVYERMQENPKALEMVTKDWEEGIAIWNQLNVLQPNKEIVDLLKHVETEIIRIESFFKGPPAPVTRKTQKRKR
jgi:hypothetical protein